MNQTELHEEIRRFEPLWKRDSSCEKHHAKHNDKICADDRFNVARKSYWTTREFPNDPFFPKCCQHDADGKGSVNSGKFPHPINDQMIRISKE